MKFIIAVFLLLTSMGLAAPKPVSFELIEIEGANITQVFDINKAGDVSGIYYADTSQGSFIRKANGDIIPIQVPGQFTAVRGLDDFGNVTGQTSSGSFVYRNGQYSFLPSGLQAFDVSGDSVVGLTTSASDGTYRGFLFRNGTTTLLNYPGATGGTIAFGISAEGKIYGNYYIANAPNEVRGFVYEAGQYRPIDFPRVTAQTQVLNGVGDIIVGAFWDQADQDASCQFEPFIAIKDKFYVIDLPGIFISGVNEDGLIVGILGSRRGFIARANSFILKK